MPLSPSRPGEELRWREMRVPPVESRPSYTPPLLFRGIPQLHGARVSILRVQTSHLTRGRHLMPCWVLLVFLKARSHYVAWAPRRWDYRHVLWHPAWVLRMRKHLQCISGNGCALLFCQSYQSDFLGFPSPALTEWVGCTSLCTLSGLQNLDVTSTQWLLPQILLF